MKNKDIEEWLLDEGIDSETSITTKDGEFYLSDILEKHLKEQLKLIKVSYDEGYNDGAHAAATEILNNR